MAKIPKEVQEFMQGKMAWVATASPEGVPNTTPKGTVKVIDDEHLVFADLFSRKTRENLLKNPKVAVTVIDEKSHKGYLVRWPCFTLLSALTHKPDYKQKIITSRRYACVSLKSLIRGGR